MIKRKFILFVGFILLIAVTGPSVQAGEKEVRVDLRFAGAAFGGLAQDGSDDAATLIHVQAKGSPGPATIFGVNQGPGANNMPAGNTVGCFDDAFLKLIPIPGAARNENSVAVTFEDLSVLNMAFDNDVFRLAELFLCIGVNRVDGVVPIKFTGGFGRFEGATGEGVLTFQSAPVIPGSNLASEIGTVTGTVFLP